MSLTPEGQIGSLDLAACQNDKALVKVSNSVGNYGNRGEISDIVLDSEIMVKAVGN